MDGGRWHLARKGELRVHTPLGYACSRCPISAVHDAAKRAFTRPIPVFTMRRNGCSRCGDLSVHDAAISARNAFSRRKTTPSPFQGSTRT